MRRKVKEALKHTTQAVFCRELSELLPSSKVAPRQLAAFLKFKGPQGGAHSIVFYAGYVYFEKIRLQQGKKKTVKREKVEEVWASKGGFSRQGAHAMRLWTHKSESWRQDQYGEIHISGRACMWQDVRGEAEAAGWPSGLRDRFPSCNIVESECRIPRVCVDESSARPH